MARLGHSGSGFLKISPGLLDETHMHNADGILKLKSRGPNTPLGQDACPPPWGLPRGLGQGFRVQGESLGLSCLHVASSEV